jgi:hypothetical protein
MELTPAGGSVMRALAPRLAALAAVAIVLTSGQAAVAVGRPAPRAYANCTKLHVVYPHGVARAGASDVVHGKSKPVTTFVVDTKTYNLNLKSDRDHDGVACEQR